MLRRAISLLPLLLLPALAGAADLRVLQSGPLGSLSELSQANEIRFVFSEPVVPLGRIPENPQIAQFRIRPAIKGSFRWSDTRTLVFTPASTLENATSVVACLGRGFAAFTGSALAEDACVRFTTPVLRLMSTVWYRQSLRVDSPVIVVLRFNQPVDPATVSRHLSLRYAPATFTPPALTAAMRRPEFADASTAFAAKVAEARRAAQRSETVAYETLAQWDQRAARREPSVMALRTLESPGEGSVLKVSLGPLARGVEGTEPSGKRQDVSLTLEPPLFITDTSCVSVCDPDRWNPFSLTAQIDPRDWRKELKVTRISDEVPALARPSRAIDEYNSYESDDSASFHTELETPETFKLALSDVGYELRPATTYRVEIPPSFKTRDGRELGYPFVAEITNGHRSAFVTMGTGFGVWEKSAGPIVPMSVRNLSSLEEWMAPIRLEDVTPLMASGQALGAPKAPSRVRMLRPSFDRLSAIGLDLKSLLNPEGAGLVWAAAAAKSAIPDTPPISTRPLGSIVQVTDLGLTVKDSPLGVLVLVTRLSDGSPVSGARVTVRNINNEVVFSGGTDASGLVQSPPLPLRPTGEDAWESMWKFTFLVTAEKDGDQAFVASSWGDGVRPWDFNLNWSLAEASPVLRGQAFADRGVYKLGEEVSFKIVLRSDTPAGMKLLDAGTRVRFVVTNSSGEEVFSDELTLGAWSSAEVKVKVPALGPLGNYSTTLEAPGHANSLSGEFLVAAYRRPEFRVDATLTESGPAGAPLKANATGRYLFGQAMKGRPVSWTLRRRMLFDPPAQVARTFPEDRFSFARVDIETRWSDWEAVRSGEGSLDAQGGFTTEFPTESDAGHSYRYLFEGEVEDASKQRIAGRATARVEAADVFVGLSWPRSFVEAGRGFDALIPVAGVDGQARGGVPVTVRLSRVQWSSARRAEGGGFYQWETTRNLIPAGEWTVTSSDSAAEPAPLHIPIPEGGYYYLNASATDEQGRTSESSIDFYALGQGYTAWERYDHNRIELVPERQTLSPGDRARILIKSPWEKATLLVTKEREGIRYKQIMQLDSSQATIEVPIDEDDVPNVYVSAVLIKGRSEGFMTRDLSDPGKPSFRVGYAELKVAPRIKTLDVAVRASKTEFRPAETASVTVAVHDRAGAPVRAEVTLWAVDYGVLSLTGYQAPDLLSAIYLDKELQVLTADSRINLISRRAIEPKGGDEGGGGGDLQSARRDFRPLAFWLGSVETDAKGEASRQVKLPDTLTTYRIMAVAGDRQSRFGSGQQDVKTAKPLIVRSAYPRFLTPGDTVTLGALLSNLTAKDGVAKVRLTSLNPELLKIGPAGDSGSRSVEVAAQGTGATDFSASALASGVARLRLEATMNGETDVVEESIPVRLPILPETVAAYGQTVTREAQRIEVPKGVIPGQGGLTLEMASTALVGLGEGAKYVVEYPFGCAEQRASRALVLMLSSDLGGAFSLPGIDPPKIRSVAQETLLEMPRFQCSDGLFGYWGGCATGSPELTAYLLSVLERGRSLSYQVDVRSTGRAYDALETALTTPSTVNDDWRAYDNAWRAYATLQLARGRKNVEASLNRLWEARERMPLFALAHMLEAMRLSGETGTRVAELERQVLNAILPEGRSAHVEELKDPSLAWMWSSNVASTSIALSTLSGGSLRPEQAGSMARYLLDARVGGRWNNTHDNALALDALVTYYRTFEAVPPAFTGAIEVDSRPKITSRFEGRSTRASVHQIPMSELQSAALEAIALSFSKEGAGTLFYGARLQYSLPPSLTTPPLDQGIAVSRTYSLATDTGQAGPEALAFKAGDLIRVSLTFRLTKEGRMVGVVDPLPGGFEPIDAGLKTTAATTGEESGETASSGPWFRADGFDHVERHDDRVVLSATMLGEGTHQFSYLVRATRPGSFLAGPTRAEEMYSPEVSGRGSVVKIDVRP